MVVTSLIPPYQDRDGAINQCRIGAHHADGLSMQSEAEGILFLMVHIRACQMLAGTISVRARRLFVRNSGTTAPRLDCTAYMIQRLPSPHAATSNNSLLTA